MFSDVRDVIDWNELTTDQPESYDTWPRIAWQPSGCSSSSWFFIQFFLQMTWLFNNYFSALTRLKKINTRFYVAPHFWKWAPQRSTYWRAIFTRNRRAPQIKKLALRKTVTTNSSKNGNEYHNAHFAGFILLDTSPIQCHHVWEKETVKPRYSISFDIKDSSFINQLYLIRFTARSFSFNHFFTIKSSQKYRYVYVLEQVKVVKNLNLITRKIWFAVIFNSRCRLLQPIVERNRLWTLLVPIS